MRMAGQWYVLSLVSLVSWATSSERAASYTEHEKLIQAVKNASNVRSPAVWKTLTAVDRNYFLSKDFMNHNSSMQPVHVGYGYSCETPQLASHILYQMEPYLRSPQSHILEIGSGSGFLTVCMNEMMHPSGLIVSLEINLKLLNRTIKTAQSYYDHVLKKPFFRNRTAFMWWNGKRGMHSRSPFDVIYFSGLVLDNEYNKLMYQIKPHGILLGFDWDYDRFGNRALWLKKWYKPSDLEVQCSNVVKCKHFYRELMKNKALLKLNDIMGEIAEDVNLNKYGRVMQRDE